MADFEASASLLCPDEIVNDDDQDEDYSRHPLLPPISVLTRSETSTPRTSQRQIAEEESHNLGRLSTTASYIAGAADIFLRASALVFTLVGLVLTVINKNDYPMTRLSSVSYFVSGYVMSVNVVVCVYSLYVVGMTIFQLINLNAQGPSNLVFLLSIFQLDQTFAYLLISSSSNALSCISALKCVHQVERNAFCERVQASAIVTFLAFFSMAMASLVSGVRLAAKIQSYSNEAQIGLSTVLDDGSYSSSPASKLLP